MIEYKNSMLSTVKFPSNPDLDLSKDFSKTTYNPENAIVPLSVDKAGSVDVGVSSYVSKAQGEVKVVDTESTPSPTDNGTKPTDNKAPDSQPKKQSNTPKQNKSSSAKKAPPKANAEKESKVDKETKGEPQKKKGEKRKETPDNDRSQVSLTEKNNQNVSNNNQSFGLANFNFNGSGSRRQARKNNNAGMKRKTFPNPSEKMNSIIDLATQLEQANLDIGHALDTGAPASELKKHTKKFESTAKSLNSKIQSLGTKLDKLTPDMKTRLGQQISPAKMESLAKKLDSSKNIMSKDNLSKIGMAGSNTLQKLSPELSKSTEKMQQSIQDMTSAILKSLGIGR
ncbi:hypothetical protein [Vibrio splendidus]|uniref:hypothetical protein n=1 Tax=Vibrio splendidus TaxID=29497 RepID=UPI003D0ADCEC